MAEGWNDFDNYGLQEIIRDLWHGKETGVLNSEIGGFEKTVYFREGVVQFAASDDPNDKLPIILINRGHFTEEQFESAKDTFKDDISVGRNLVEHGLISQQELVEGAKAQVHHICTQLLHGERGRYQFKEGPLPEGVVSLPMVFPDALLEAVLSMEDKSWIGSRFGAGLDFVCDKNPDKPLEFEQVQLPDYAESIYELLDGERDFNHLAFEVEVDDFVLLKFLYGLKYLGYIQITTVPHDEEEEPDIGDVRDELSDALSQADDIDKLGLMSMDETVEMSAIPGLGDEQALENLGSLDATMEISKDILAGAEPALKMDEDLDDASAEDEEDDFDDGFQEDEMSEPEEEGLDDLGGMDNDILAEELAKMTPSEEVDLDGMQLPLGVEADHDLDEDEEAEEEEEVEEESADEGLDKRKRILMIVATAVLILSGMALLGKPYIEKWLFPPLELGDQTTEQTPPEGDPTMPTAPPDEAAATAENAEPAAGGETMPESTPPPEDSQTVAEDTPDPQGEQDPVVSEPEPQPLEAVADATPQQDPEPPPANVPEPTPEPAVETTQPEATTSVAEAKPGHDGIRLYSPVAENWNTETNRPKGSPEDVQAKVTLGQPMLGPTATLPYYGANADMPTAPPDDTSAQVGGATVQAEKPAQQSKDGQTPVAQNADRGAGVNGPLPPREGLERMLDEGRFSEAAQGFHASLTPRSGQYTLALFLACQESSITRAIEAAGSDHQIFVLPRAYNGKSCYWVCWGTFDSHFDALSFAKKLPPAMGLDISTVMARKLDALL